MLVPGPLMVAGDDTITGARVGALCFISLVFFLLGIRERTTKLRAPTRAGDSIEG